MQSAGECRGRQLGNDGLLYSTPCDPWLVTVLQGPCQIFVLRESAGLALFRSLTVPLLGSVLLAAVVLWLLVVSCGAVWIHSLMWLLAVQLTTQIYKRKGLVGLLAVQLILQSILTGLRNQVKKLKKTVKKSHNHKGGMELSLSLMASLQSSRYLKRK